MAEPDRALFEAASSLHPQDPALAEAWHYVLEAVRVGFLDRADLTSLPATIEAGEDCVAGELGLEHLLDGTFRVSFIHNQIEVAPGDLCGLVREALRLLADS